MNLVTNNDNALAGAADARARALARTRKPAEKGPHAVEKGGWQCGGRSSEGAGAAGGADRSVACAGAGFTCPRNSTDGRSRASRTSRIVSGAGSGGRSGELASKLRGGIRTVYTGSPAGADGGGEFSVFLRCGGSGGARTPTSREGWDGGDGAGAGGSVRARGKSHEQAEASA